jgi:Tfp pilus assembly protein PilO
MSARDRTVLLVVLAAGALAGFWLGVLGPKRHEAARLSSQIAQERTRLEAAKQREAAAERAKARYDADYATVARLGKAVPVQEDVPSLVYQLDTAADAHRIDFHDFKVGASPTGAQAAATPATQIAQVGAAEKGTDTSSTAAPGAPSTVGPAALPVLPFTFTFTGGYFDMQRFIRALDRLTFLRADTLQVAGRLLTINGLSLTVDPNRHSRVQASIDANAFQLPADEGLTAGASAQGPAAQNAAPQPPSSSTPTATVTGVTP